MHSVLPWCQPEHHENLVCVGSNVVTPCGMYYYMCVEIWSIRLDWLDFAGLRHHTNCRPILHCVGQTPVHLIKLTKRTGRNNSRFQIKATDNCSMLEPFQFCSFHRPVQYPIIWYNLQVPSQQTTDNNLNIDFWNTPWANTYPINTRDLTLAKHPSPFYTKSYRPLPHIINITTSWQWRVVFTVSLVLNEGLGL